MPHEIGGRAGKYGLKYEREYLMLKILDILQEKIEGVMIEPVGEDEIGVDIIVYNKNGDKDLQQLKSRNASKDMWSISDLIENNIIKKWKWHLTRDENIQVSLVTPLFSNLIIDILTRAKTHEDPQNFYNYQIKSSSKDLVKCFNKLAWEWQLNPDNKYDLEKMVDFLNRINYRIEPSEYLKDRILERINFLFSDDPESVYDKITNYLDESILGKYIDVYDIKKFIGEEKLTQRELANDTRVLKNISDHNSHFDDFSNFINNELFIREEVKECYQRIREGHSVVMHGEAGIGKSGVVSGLIKTLDAEHIPYLAIKLDKHEPSGKLEKWSERLGFPASIIHCINSISRDKEAVIIMDQLDSLRWTSQHSQESLTVCMELIKSVERINEERKNKISIVFVCRTYDLNNDNQIAKLFETDQNKSFPMTWSKLKVDALSEETVKGIIGHEYKTLSSKVKHLLRKPSNLYIWTKVEHDEIYNITSTNNLIRSWWEQLSRQFRESNISEPTITPIINNLVESIWNSKQNAIRKSRLTYDTSVIEYLVSNGFLVSSEDKVSFAHQSIFDYFVVKQMYNKYSNGEPLRHIFGSEQNQTPQIRYQAQMLLQEILEDNTQEFIDIGEDIWESSEVRFYIKYLFMELLNEIDEADEAICEFILGNIKNEKYHKYLIDGAISSNKEHIDLLLYEGVLDGWVSQGKFDIPMKLLSSIYPAYDKEHIEFIENVIFKYNIRNTYINRIIGSDLWEGTQELFDLKIKCFKFNPEFIPRYIDGKELLKENEVRFIALLKTLIEIDYEKKDVSISERFKHIQLSNPEYIIDELINIIPLYSEETWEYSDWTASPHREPSFKRISVELMVKASMSLAQTNPNLFWEKFKEYLGKGYMLLNEVIIYSLENMSTDQSDKVIDYLGSNINNNMFINTDNNEDQLTAVKRVLSKHSNYCSEESFTKLERTVVNYVPNDIVRWYEYRKSMVDQKYRNAYSISFWGDFQYNILPCLPQDRLDSYTKDLLRVLERKFENGSKRFERSLWVRSGFVRSPVDNKPLSVKNWLKIITNKNLRDPQKRRSNFTSDGVIANNIDDFASSFRKAVENQTKEMIDLVLDNKENILFEFIDAFLEGLASSNSIKEIESRKIEGIIHSFDYDHESKRAATLCRLVRNSNHIEWSNKTFRLIQDIATNHRDPILGKPNVSSADDEQMNTVEMLRTNSINCTRGEVALVIGNVLWKKKEYFPRLKETIEGLLTDENPAVKYASTEILLPLFNTHEEYVKSQYFKLVKNDYRLSAFRGSHKLLLKFYDTNTKEVVDIIESCFNSDDKHLIEFGARLKVVVYMHKNEFKELPEEFEAYSSKQQKYIVQMIFEYFNLNDTKCKAKELLMKLVNIELKTDFPMSSIFLSLDLNLPEDDDLIIQVMESTVGENLFDDFIKYLEENAISLIKYEKVIFKIGEQIILKQETNDLNWFSSRELSQVILMLYSEVSDGRSKVEKRVSEKCLDLWDQMFKYNFGRTRQLSKDMMDL